MFTYLAMRQDFLNDMFVMRNEMDEHESEKDYVPSLINKIKEEINYNLRCRTFNVSNYEPKTWIQSMLLFEDIMLEMGDDIGISFEYMMDNRQSEDNDPQDMKGYNKRVDVIIGGYDKCGYKTLVVVEMKGWGGDEDTHKLVVNNGVLSYYGRKKNGNIIEDNPAKEVVEYCEQLKKDNQLVENGRIKLIPIVWMYNFDYENDRIITDKDKKKDIWQQLEEKYKYNNVCPKVFKKDEEVELIKFFCETFGGSNDIFSEFRKGFKTLTLHKEISNILEGTTDIRLRADQQDCVNQLIKKIESGYKGYLFVEGRAGSGKSVVGIELLKYCISAGIEVKYYITEGAPINAYLNNNKVYEKYFNLLSSQEDGSNQKRVIIVDEAHNLFRKAINQLNKQTNAVIILLYDIGQTTEPDSIFYGHDKEIEKIESQEIKNLPQEDNKAIDVHEPFYTLTSQFRCNMDDGYLRFIDGIFDSRDDRSFTAVNIDFDVRLIKDEKTLKSLAEKDEYVILTGPKYAKLGGEIILKESNYTIPQWTLNYDAVFLDNKLDGNKNHYSGVFSVRGLEEKKIIVYIGDEKIPEDGKKHYNMDLFFSDNKIQGHSLVINMYRVMLTRGTESCYIYCENTDLREYLHKTKRIKYFWA